MHKYLGKVVRPGMVVRFEDSAGKTRPGVVLVYIPTGEDPIGPSVVVVDFTTKSSWLGAPKELLSVTEPKVARRYSLDPKRPSHIFGQSRQLHVIGVEMLIEEHGYGLGWIPARIVRNVKSWAISWFASSNLTDENSKAILRQLRKP